MSPGPPGMAAAGLLLLLTIAGCGKNNPPESARHSSGKVPSPIRFQRVTEDAGITFRHENGESGKKWFLEWLGGGVAFVDLNGDSWPDIFLVNGGRLPGWNGKGEPQHALYLNNRDGTFTDASSQSGLRSVGYGVGCAAGDYDGDGDLDLYVTGFQRNALYRNLGGGRFDEVAAAAGLKMGGLSTGCAFGDYDGDGDLDLYVSRYVQYDLSANVQCRKPVGLERTLMMCRPTVYHPAPHALWRNNGNGTFTEVTRASGAAVEPGRGLGALWTDYDADGRPDCYVANDLTPNFLFHNMGKGRLREIGLESATSVNEAGAPQAGMGVASGDADGDGQLDLLVTNFAGEYYTLYRQITPGQFQDVSAQTGLVEGTRPLVGFGVGLQDLDLDGLPDILAANGHVTEDTDQAYEGVGLTQPRVVLRNVGGRFERLRDVWADEATAAFKVGRGLAFADYDRDGDVDAIASNLRDAPDLLRNDSPRQGGWIGLRLKGSGKNPFAVGARVELRVGARKLVQEVQAGGSYCSQNDLGLLFGLGAARRVDQITVHWPGGAIDRWSGVESDRWLSLQSGREPVPVAIRLR